MESGARDQIGRVRVYLSKEGWHRLAKVNRELGDGYIRSYDLREELSAYLTLHRQAGCEQAAQCLKLRYDNVVNVRLRKFQEVWYVIDLWHDRGAGRFKPAFIYNGLDGHGVSVKPMCWQSDRHTKS